MCFVCATLSPQRGRSWAYVARGSGYNIEGTTRDVVVDEMTCAINHLKFVKLVCTTLRRFLQMS